MPADSGVTVVTMLVCFFIFAREAAGATSARHSLRPLIGEGRMLAQLGRITLRDREAVAAGHTGCLKCEAVAAPRLSSSAKADDPVRRGVSALLLAPVEYWIPRWSLSSGSPEARPGG